jgi:carotenoid cleavage dioxygenase-like enzyme
MPLSRRHLLHAAALSPALLRCLSPLATAHPAGAAGTGMPMDLDHLTHGFAPVQDELDLHDLPVRGEIPRDLTGTWLRNGPNPAFPPLAYVYPWDGDGMLHALRLEAGRAGYANRFVRTAGLEAERRAGRALYGSLTRPVPVDPALLGPDADPTPIKNLANTNVIGHAGRVLALWEGGLPHEVDERLATRGRFDFAGNWRGGFTAHPKLDPVSGELLVFGYSPHPPYLRFGTVDAAGRVTRVTALDVPQPYMVHDFICTPRYAVFVLCPVVLDFSGNGPPLVWKPELGTRIAVVERADPAESPRWFQAEAFFTFHFMNACEQDGRIIVDQVRRASFPEAGRHTPPTLWRLTLDLSDGSAQEQQLQELVCEFPRIDPRRAGLPNRYGWTPVETGHERGASTFSAIARYDLQTGSVAVHDFGPGQEVDEPAFLPRPGGRAEGDGFILTYVYDRAGDTSRAALLDAVDITAPPIAEIMLPRRVPHGLHGNWLPA